jgi:hypothetical protein
MITAQIDLTQFNRGIQGLISATKKSGRVVVAKEAGELIKTLVRISPPKNPTQSRANIKRDVTNSFSVLGSTDTRFDSNPSKEGKSGVKWFSATSRFLYGMTKDTDMTKAGERDLLRVYYQPKTNYGQTFMVMPLQNRKTSQRAAIATRIVTKKKQVDSVVKRLQGHIGRLKAGWMVAVWKGGIKITGGYLPPQWVTRHQNGARGRADTSGLLNDAAPSLVIANFAKGINSRASERFVKYALNIRAKAMVANAALFVAGKKPLSSYAR